jgi:hypothetical protein
MFTSLRLVPALVCSLLVVAAAWPVAAANEPWSPARIRCVRMHQLWLKYETEHCPNTTGQRAQAEWAVYRCQVNDLERGLPELTRLLKRDLIPPPEPVRTFRIADQPR